MGLGFALAAAVLWKWFGRPPVDADRGPNTPQTSEETPPSDYRESSGR